jgi:hypothetical protein
MPRHRLRIPHTKDANAVERPMVWSDDDPREALQVGDVIAADGVRYVVSTFEMERDGNGGLRTASYS